MKQREETKAANKILCPYEEIKKSVLEWLGPKILKRMKEKGYSLVSLSKATGIGVSTLFDYISGYYEPSLSKIICLCDALDVDWRFFFEKDYETHRAIEDTEDIAKKNKILIPAII
jgi:transcriptional regulator with XRE-family HTH domain